MQNQHLWYTRRGSEIRGPFSAGLVSRHILLGRICLDDELSQDREAWMPVSAMPELIPEAMRVDTNDPLAQERLHAARRWADERLRERRGPNDIVPAGVTRRGGDRRQQEPAEVVRHRTAKAGRDAGQTARFNGKWAAIVIGGIVLFVAGLLFLSQPASENAAWDCTVSARPGVNWSDCRMEGVHLDKADLTGARLRNVNLSGASLREGRLKGSDLSFATLSIADLSAADLQEAVMLGVSLRNADLRNAKLQGADLSYADLSGARLEGANLEGARLDHAIWVDKSVCAKGSLGRCIH